MKKDIFIGGAWPYANNFLHVGHLASLLPGDVIARYYRLKEDNVIYVSGSDCHGTPITERAKKENTTPSKIANYYHEEFIKTFNNLDFSYDLYSSTTSLEHIKNVQEYFKTLYKNNYIYEKEDKEDFCETCNKFLSDREITGTCPHCDGISTGEQCEECLTNLESDEILNKKCITCNNKTITKNNRHLYFKLTAFEKELQDLINKNKNTWRKNAIGEAQKYLDMGLRDRAATRQIDWGIEVPIKGFEDKKIYVWFEAVLGYLTIGNLVANKKGIDFNTYLNNDNSNLKTYYVHGKDNIPFHTTIYPALILGLKNNYRLPDYIVSGAYVNLNNEKMSKSTGNLITVNDLLKEFDKDTIRFYFTFNAPETKDTNCSLDEIIVNHNKYLVGTLGNFINRNLAFINKKNNALIKEANIDQQIKELTIKTYNEVSNLIERGELKAAINKVFEYISLGNKYYDENTPWIKIKEDIESFNDITYTCTYMIANISNLINPFMPSSSIKIKEILNIKENTFNEIIIKGDIKLNDVSLLFNKIEN